MKAQDFLLRVVALRDVQKRYYPDTTDVIELEKELDEIIQKLLNGEDVLE